MKKNLRYSIATLALMGVVQTASMAQNGTVDPNFQGFGFDLAVEDLAIQPNDGKIVAMGNFISYSGSLSTGLARLNSDGTFDPSFDVGTGLSGPARNVVAVQPNDGKILLAGYFYTYNNVDVSAIIRLNTDGSLDNTFQVTGCNDQINAIAIQNDGKIIVGGWFTEINGTAVNHIVRLNSDGSIDNTFNVGTGADSFVLSMALQNDGKVVIGGAFTTYNGVTANRLARLNSDGSMDPTFNANGGADGQVRQLLLQPDGKIIIAGSFYSYNGHANARVARVYADGTADLTFNQNGTGLDGEVYTIALQSDGKLLVGGYFQNYNQQPVGGIVRLHPNGNRDYHFENTGANNPVRAIELFPDSRILVGGEFTTFSSANRNYIVLLQNCLSSIVTISGQLDVCPFATTQLSATSDQGVQSWYSAATDGTYLAPGANFQTPALSQTTTFYMQDSLECGISVVAVPVNVFTIETGIYQSEGSLYVNNSQEGVSYQWVNCADMSIIDGATNWDYTPTSNGNYAAIVELYGCIDTSACATFIGVGIDETMPLGQLELYPNPANNLISVTLTPNVEGTITISLMDVTGKRVLDYTPTPVVANQTMTWNLPLTNHPSGIYSLVLTSSQGHRTTKRVAITH